MKMFQSDWTKVSSLRQVYDDMVDFAKSTGGSTEHLCSWEDFKKNMKGVEGLESIPEDYRDYDVKITADRKVVESFNGYDSETNLNH